MAARDVSARPAAFSLDLVEVLVGAEPVAVVPVAIAELMYLDAEASSAEFAELTSLQRLPATFWISGRGEEGRVSLVGHMCRVGHGVLHVVSYSNYPRKPGAGGKPGVFRGTGRGDKQVWFTVGPGEGAYESAPLTNTRS
jgi:hypothetical protein